MERAIETINLRRTFGDKLAVDDLNLVVEPGSLFGFLGPNGAGKSTTIRILTGLLRTTSGTATVLGHDVDREPEKVKRTIGVVPEELVLFDRLTGREQLRFVGRMYDLPRRVIDSRTDELLALMDLTDEKKLIVDYSHGMKKKLAISAALIHEPRVLFLDEPFEGIDAISSRLIKSLLKQLLATGVTIFLTSHILEIVEALCRDIAIIHKGRLVAQGPLEELRSSVAADSGEDSDGRVKLEQLFIELVGGDVAETATLSWLQ